MDKLVRSCYPLVQIIRTVNNAASVSAFEDVVNFIGFGAPYYSILRETAVLENKPEVLEEIKEDTKGLPQCEYVFVPFKMPIVKKKLMKVLLEETMKLNSFMIKNPEPKVVDETNVLQEK